LALPVLHQDVRELPTREPTQALEQDRARGGGAERGRLGDGIDLVVDADELIAQISQEVSQRERHAVSPYASQWVETSQYTLGRHAAGAGPLTVAAEDLRRFTADVFARAGMPDADARVVADALVWANLRGVDSHGVLRVPRYVDWIRAGDVNPAP